MFPHFITLVQLKSTMSQHSKQVQEMLATMKQSATAMESYRTELASVCPINALEHYLD